MPRRLSSVEPRRRSLTPSPPLAVAPLIVTDRTCFALVGLTDRQLRDLLAKHPEIPRRVEGHRVLVAAADLVAFVRAVASPDLAALPPPETDDDQPSDVDAVLAKLGRRRVVAA